MCLHLCSSGALRASARSRVRIPEMNKLSFVAKLVTREGRSIQQALPVSLSFERKRFKARKAHLPSADHPWDQQGRKEDSGSLDVYASSCRLAVLLPLVNSNFEVHLFLEVGIRPSALARDGDTDLRPPCSLMAP